MYYCMMDSASQLLVLLTQAPAKPCATDAGADSAPAKLCAIYAGADSAPAKPCVIYNCMKDSASRLAVLLTQAPAKLCVISASRTALLDWLFCWTQALAKLWAKWKCMSNSNNLHKP